MKEIISENEEEKLKLARNLIKTNYELSGKEVLNPQIYKKEEKSLCFSIYDNDDLVAGMNVIVDYYGWAHIYMTWVKEGYRGKGLGSKVMNMVVDYAKKNKLTGLRTETWDFQARGFYEKHGFKVYGMLENHPKGITEYYLYRYC